MSYTRIIPIEFHHCDPAGIVFYPRYFEMTNSVVENYFEAILGYPFAEIHRHPGNGVPTVSIDCDFHAPSRLGDKLPFTLAVTRVGGASLEVTITAALAGETRLTARLTLVWMVGGKARPWPEAIRAKLTQALEQGRPA